MPFLLLLVGAVVIVAAVRETAGTLGADLAQDVPGFAKWALAIGGVGALQWVPGLQTIARSLLGLVILVIVLNNWSAFLSGIKALSPAPASVTPPPTPAQAYISNPTSPSITAAEISGTGNINAAAAPIAALGLGMGPLAALNPAAYVATYGAGFGGVS
jgi:hypothetical protein